LRCAKFSCSDLLDKQESTGKERSQLITLRGWDNELQKSLDEIPKLSGEIVDYYAITLEDSFVNQKRLQLRVKKLHQTTHRSECFDLR